MLGERVGHYRVGDLIGRGGMGSVYRGIDEMLGRDVALKILNTDPSVSPQRFRTEALALARVSHPGIATVYQLLEHDDRLVMAMELVQGQTLKQVVEQSGRLTPVRAAEICGQILGALAHAHNAGIVHRDLKPANLMITDTGTIKIMDFGIARFDGAAHLTQAGFTMGTPAYMAPEQLQGGAIDARTDLYALGVVFYRLVSGVLPFHGDTPYEMAQSQLTDQPKAIDLPDVPSWVHDVVSRALAKNPSQRFQSALEFQETLASCLAGRPLPTAYRGDGETEQVAVLPPPPAPAERSAAIAALLSRRPLWWTAAAGVTAAMIGIGWAVSARPTQTPPPSPVSSETSSAAPASPAIGDAASGKPAGPVASPKPLRPTPSPAPAPAPAPAPTETDAAAAAASAIFSHVKLLVVDGKRASERDVLLLFAGGQVSALPADRGEPIITLPYRDIARATYTFAADPVWDPEFAEPAERFNVPGFLGRSRHWLVLQTQTAVAILRLDENKRRDVLQALESRAGVGITRVAPGNKTGR